MKKILSVLLTLAMLLAMTTGFAAVAEEETRTFVDSAGREVEIPVNIERIIPSGQLAQSFMWPLAADRLVSSISLVSPLLRNPGLIEGE